MNTAKQQQIIDKKAELEREAAELSRFMETPAPNEPNGKDPTRALAFTELGEAEQGRQRAQVAAMQNLAAILGERIAAFHA